MSKRCVGCMKMKNNSPICEHCGYNENIPNLPHELPIGTMLKGQYRVGKELGQGGFGITYIGWDCNLDIPVAIKEYYPNSFVSREASQSLTVACSDSVGELYRTSRERFLREARALARLRSVPGIVDVYNFFEENNTAYIIMEYVQGMDLKQYIKLLGRPLIPAELFVVLRPILYVLSKVHEEGLVHRDISPDNIMIQPDGSAKLLDFGAVREVGSPELEKMLSQSTDAILKHGFAPIEQYQRRGNLGPWTDVYALCATAYYCLTGKIPPDAPERMIEQEPVHWESIRGLTAQQVEAFRKGLAALPKDRTASIPELYTSLFGTPMSWTGMQTGTQTTTTTHTNTRDPVPDYPNYTISLDGGPDCPLPQKDTFFKRLVRSVRYQYHSLLPNLNPRAKAIGTIALAAVLLFGVGSLLFAPKNGWVERKDNVYYYIDGDRQTGWQEIEDLTYFFDDAGVLQTGWQEIGSKTYHFASDGAMMTGWQTIHNEAYYFDADGALQTGWQTINGERYYFDDSGIMLTDWQTIDDETYYFDTRGMMQSGWQTIDGKYLFFEEDGAWVSDVWKKNILTYDPLSNISGIDEEDIISVTFLDNTKDAPADSIDVSKYDSEGNILAWKEKNGSYYDVYIAADGGMCVDSNYYCEFFFYQCTNLKKINFNDCFHTDKATSMYCMFDSCRNLTEVDLSCFNISNVTNMNFMFDNCDNIKNLDLQNWDVSKVTSYDSFMDDGDTINGRPWKEFFE